MGDAQRRFHQGTVLFEFLGRPFANRQLAIRQVGNPRRNLARSSAVDRCSLSFRNGTATSADRASVRTALYAFVASSLARSSHSGGTCAVASAAVPGGRSCNRPVTSHTRMVVSAPEVASRRLSEVKATQSVPSACLVNCQRSLALATSQTPIEPSTLPVAMVRLSGEKASDFTPTRGPRN